MLIRHTVIEVAILDLESHVSQWMLKQLRYYMMIFVLLLYLRNNRMMVHKKKTILRYDWLSLVQNEMKRRKYNENKYIGV